MPTDSCLHFNGPASAGYLERSVYIRPLTHWHIRRASAGMVEWLTFDVVAVLLTDLSVFYIVVHGSCRRIASS